MNLVPIGKTIVATCGTIGFLGSFFLWNVSGQLTLSEILYLSSITAGSILALACGFVPKVSSRVQGAIGLAGGLVILLGGTYMISCCASYSIFQSYNSFAFSLTVMIVIGCILVIARKET